MRGSRPQKEPIYPAARECMPEVLRRLEELLRPGVTKEAVTDFINPLLVVGKSNGEVRICLDIRGLNEGTASDEERTVSIDDLLIKAEQSDIYSKIDVAEAFGRSQKRTN